jgi:hypothetical protein
MTEFGNYKPEKKRKVVGEVAYCTEGLNKNTKNFS